MVKLRDLAALSLGAAIAALGALFLGEYEYDQLLPILAGPLLALLIGEVVVSVGHRREPVVAAMVAVAAAVAVILAGIIDANGVSPVKPGAYLSAVLAVAVGVWRVLPPRRRRAAGAADHNG